MAPEVPFLGEQRQRRGRSTSMARQRKRLKASDSAAPISGSCSTYLDCLAEDSCGSVLSCLNSVEQERPALYTPPWAEAIQAVPHQYCLEDAGTAALSGFEFGGATPPNLSREGWSGDWNWWATEPDVRQCDTAATYIGTAEEELYCLLEDQQQRAYQMIYKDLANMIGNVESRAEESDLLCSSAPRTPAGCERVQVREHEYSEEGRSGWCAVDDAPESLACLAEEGGSAAEQERALAALTERLLECGEALVADDGHRCSEVVSTIQQHSTPEGTHLQRLAHYYALALVARLNATGADLHSAIRRRDQQAVVEAEKVYDSKDPTASVAHHFSTAVFLDALEGAGRVHIVDYGISSGQQWHALMQALAQRPQGPPRLRITGIELPQPGLNPAGTARETGRRLARWAASLGIPFSYKALACKWESVHSSDLGLQDDEVLAVSCTFHLRHLLDDSVVLSNPRRTVLERICSMRPRVFFTAELSLAANAPFLLTRLRESIPTSYSFFDALESTLPRDSGCRRLIEEEILGRDILNMIACEGADRIERPEGYHQWHRRLLNAGFQQLPLEHSRFVSTRDMLAGYHDDWTIGRDQGWILTGWKGRVHHAYAAWKPS